MKEEALTGEIIGAAMEVLNALRPGLDEKIYENALVVECEERGLTVSQQQAFRVTYKNREVGKLIPDLIFNDCVIVDTKVVSEFAEAHIAQMIGYLHITNLSVGLLINFKHAKLTWKRVVL